MAPVSAEISKRGYKEYIIHTGQHFDDNMSKVFFDELNIPQPNLSLSLGTGSHGKMTALMLMELEIILQEKKPSGVIIYGDTNSTLAAALAAVKLHIPIAHVEAGPRIYDINTPEEINRIVADHAAKLRFCPDIVSVQNLAKENILNGVYFTGDVMFDSYLIFSKVAREKSTIINSLNLNTNEYALLTIHRPNNTDTEDALKRVIKVLENAKMKIVFPVHPRTEAAFKRHGLWESLKAINHAKVIPAVGYLDILELINNAKIVLTDSGGLQKEAFFAGKPVLVLFHTTPWPQIQSCGWQKCCWDNNGIDVNRVIELISSYMPTNRRPNLFGDGNAASKIVDLLENHGWFK
ncbi:UDP-N-acetylglucosamine 2-epimerase (non-hydrolyzing) [Desulforamulus ferrireducens]|uniref:UDP-N-acetylglucosamine 2-epimerase (Non-hydrolyzing) n=2 Tax=Desulforamulus ferrireducens TaxID=1833852 RepID=A0A1S6J0U7_9FIRM|nr:UDP-N-acetylglucosamine 2-epimerase (non-hydrolyzing) [Desulforamulus ferrireducens]